MLSQQTAEMLGYTGSEGAVDRLDKTFRLEHDARRESVVTDRQKWPQLSEQRCGKLMDLKKYSKNHRVRNLKSQNVGANPAAFLTLCFFVVPHVCRPVCGSKNVMGTTAVASTASTFTKNIFFWRSKCGCKSPGDWSFLTLCFFCWCCWCCGAACLSPNLWHF